MIRAKAVTHGYKNVVIDQFDLEIKEQDFVCLLGPSGCGKSTLLRLFAGLEIPTSGQILGLPLDRGFVFQEPTLLPWQTALQNVLLSKALSKDGLNKESNEPALKLLDQFELREHSDKYPHELSGGMKMRVSVARALLSDPQLMLLDEPFSALDETIRFRLQEDFRKIWADKKFTTLFVTHSIQEAVFLCNRILLLSAKGGQVVEQWIVPEIGARDKTFRRNPAILSLIEEISTKMTGRES